MASASIGNFGPGAYPVIGDQAVDTLTLDDFERVMGNLPAKLTIATRRNVGQLLTRIMTKCVYPLRLRADNPIPRRFLPTAPNRKAFGYLYPSDDARLMACAAVPLEFRLLRDSSRARACARAKR